MLVRTTVYLEEEDLKKMKHLLVDSDKSFSELLGVWVKKYIEVKDLNVEPSKDLKLEVARQALAEAEQVSDEPRKGVCFNCKRFTPVKIYEFVFDMERMTADLCSTCWTKASKDGSAR